MPFYLKSSQVPKLKPYTFTQRAEIISLALSFMTVPDKFVLNMAKLAVLTPPFILAAKISQWWVLIPMILLGLFYPLITNPLQLNLSLKHLDKALKTWQADHDPENIN